jgi:hypothetical protein
MPFDKHGCPGSEGNDWSRCTVTPFALDCGALDEETTAAPFWSYSAHLPSSEARRLPKEVHRPVRLPLEHSLEAAGTRFLESMEGDAIAGDAVGLTKLMDRRNETLLATSIVIPPFPEFNGITIALLIDAEIAVSKTKNANM